MDKIAAIVLASGKATRFKSNKLLYEVNSKALIHYAIDNVSRSNFQQWHISRDNHSRLNVRRNIFNSMYN